MHTNGTVNNTPTLQIPYNKGAEDGIIGSLLIDPQSIFEIQSIINGTDFYTITNARIFQAVQDVIADGGDVDEVTVAAKMAKWEAPEFGWVDFITNYVLSTPNSAYIATYANIVRETSTRRKLINTAQKIATMGYGQDGIIDDQLNEAESMMFDVRGNVSEDIKRSDSYCTDFLEQFERLRFHDGSTLGASSGLLDLDRLLDGFQAPHQYVLAARPGMGKSALAINIANHITAQGGVVLMFTLEMSKTQVINRMISSITGINSRKVQKPWLLTEEEAVMVRQVTGELSTRKLLLDTTPSISPAEIKAKAMRIASEYGKIDLIIIDHLILMRPDRALNRTDQEFGEMTNSLRVVGKMVNAPILTLSQLNRGVESRQDKRPMLSDLRESGRIEENAYAVIFLYRDNYYNEMSERGDLCDIIVAKNREGATGGTVALWDASTTTFKNAAVDAVEL